MVVKNAKFEITVVKPEQYPVNHMPDVAFAGRSNIGKSSIINTLINRKSLARVGATPGKTREINFYNIDNLLYLVDLPGYGYASVSKGKKSLWEGMIETYLYSRTQLKLIIMMVDIRHTPSLDDKTMYEWLIVRGIPHVIVAAKADKIPRGQVCKRLQDIKVTLGMTDDIKLIPFSSHTKQGKDELWNEIDSVLGSIEN